MKRISILLLASGLLFLSNVSSSNHVSAQKISAVPIDVEIPMAPTPVRADGKIHLVYELHLTNLRARSLELTRLEVLRDEANALPLASYQDAELLGRLARPGASSDLADKRIIGGGMRAVVFLQITFSTNAEVPVALRHRLFFKSEDPKVEERVVDTARVVVQRKPALVVGPPVHGEGWLASNGMSNTSSHRRTLLVVNGKARIAQRGQVLALLGNSGNSDAPHLHFHITDGNSPLGAEGVPYVIESFEMQGMLPSKGLLIEGGWKPQPSATPDKRRLEIPIENAVVRFP